LLEISGYVCSHHLINCSLLRNPECEIALPYLKDVLERMTEIERAAKALSCCRDVELARLLMSTPHFCDMARSVDFPPLAEERVQRTSAAMRQN
jgi:hypothetical protein